MDDVPLSNDALFSLPEGEGAGAPLAAAAGDVAGGAHVGGYSSITQTTTIVAYHLLGLGAVDPPTLRSELLELSGTDGGPSVYRSLSPSFRIWLETGRKGEPERSSDLGVEPACRVMPIGVWYRRRPDELVDAALDVASITHRHGPTLVVAAAMAGAVAAGAFAQTGRDLVLATAETAERAIDRLSVRRRGYDGMDDLAAVADRLRRGADFVGLPHPDVPAAIRAAGDGTALDQVVMAAVLGSIPGVESYRLVETAAHAGGSPAGALVGAIVGARVGIRQWPWIVPNDTWFAEIGRRLVDHHAEIRDLPVPYAVEERSLSSDAGHAPY